jgi:hypothetical protein
MATSFDVIGERALSVIDDYKLRKLYDVSVDAFEQKIDSFIFNAAPRFWQCNNSLSYDSNLRQFDADLTDMEIQILADYCVIAWWQGETDVASQIALKLKASSFSFNSEAQNFKEKQNVIDKLREEVDRQTTNYLLSNISSYEY